MNYKLPLYIIVICFAQFGFSQQKQIDSLENVFSKLENDSLILAKSDKLMSYYRKRNVELHYYIINRALNLKIRGKKRSIKQKAVATVELGLYYRGKGQLDSAIVAYDKAIKMFLQIKDSSGVIYAKTSKGSVLKSKGNFLESINIFNDALIFYESQGTKAKYKLLVTKVNLAGVYTTMKDWENAAKHLEEIYNDSLAKTQKGLLGAVCINLVGVKTKQNSLEEALKYAKEALELKKRPGSRANLYTNIGAIYEKKSAHQLADDYFRKALEQYTIIKNTHGIQKSYNNIGNNLSKLRKFDEAEYFLLKSNALLEKGNNINSLWHNYDMLSALYENTKDYKKSLEFANKRAKIKDSLLSIEKQKEIANLETFYKTEKIEREKSVAEQAAIIANLENQKNRNRFIGALLLAALIILLSIFYFSRTKTRKKTELVLVKLQETKKRLEVEKKHRNSELKALKAQMNPHFIFNALNSIQEYIVLNKKNLASDYLGKFADLIRTYLNHSNKGLIPLEEELRCLEMYLELEELRFEEKLIYAVHVADDIDVSSVFVPTMLIQPYIENALKHGLLHKKNNRKLTISILKTPDQNSITCIIEDNGIGREKALEIKTLKNETYQSFGTKATKERLDLLNHGKTNLIGVEIEDLFQGEESIGTKVTVNIPLSKRNAVNYSAI
ncbi:MAG: histidine kinase [Kordia sp.]|uniref:tetratricopeptide repeat-containing sensor histidine kinase n=1 Tax=Kordia sp. TaxID=1965332 RepID=UPI0038588720